MKSPVVPIRRVFRIVNGGTPSASAENWGGDIAWATPTDLAKCDGARILSTQRTLTPVGLESASNLVPAGGLIISSRAPIGYVVETVKPTAINQGCKGLSPRQEVDIRFFRYQLSAMTTQLQSRGQGSTFAEISSDALASSPIRVPSLSGQREMADSLDVATAKVDALIVAKRRQQWLLEQRRWMLPEAALARLQSSEPMVPLKHLVGESNLRNDARSSSVMLSVSIHHGIVPRTGAADLRAQPDDLVRYKLCKPGDIVVNRMRAFQGGVGEVRHSGVVSPDYTVLHVKDFVSSGYLHFVMRSPWFVSEMTQRLRGIGSTNQGQVRTPRINFAQLGEIRVPVPSGRSQEHFVEELSAREAGVTGMIDLQSKQLALLAERQHALITATVNR